MKFLIIQTAFLGDVVLATSLVESLHRSHPDATIDFLLRRGNESLLEEHPLIRNVLIWDKKNGKYKGIWRLLQQVRKERYEAVFNCQRFAASGFLTAFSGAISRIGFVKNPFSIFFTTRIPHTIGAQHEVERNHNLIGSFADDAGPAPPRLYPSTFQIEKAKALLPAAPYVCLAPTSVWFTKQWPTARWIELCDLIPSQFSIVFLGAPSDSATCDAIALKVHRTGLFNACGKLGLLESAVAMQGAEMNVVNDSAPVHIASAMNAPVTAIFCSTLPAFGFTPLSEKSRIVEVQEKLACRPCGLHGKLACPEGHFNCGYGIKAIAVSQIMELQGNK